MHDGLLGHKKLRVQPVLEVCCPLQPCQLLPVCSIVQMAQMGLKSLNFLLKSYLLFFLCMKQSMIFLNFIQTILNGL